MKTLTQWHHLTVIIKEADRTQIITKNSGAIKKNKKVKIVVKKISKLILEIFSLLMGN